MMIIIIIIPCAVAKAREIMPMKHEFSRTDEMLTNCSMCSTVGHGLIRVDY